jgi:pimeloyl-ACP methyl ester carboxylesterase
MLECPSCERAFADSERFCPSCGMPLVRERGAEHDPSERERMARKIKPQYSEGELVKVARASSQVEADFISGLLLEEGIPSMSRRALGVDVPDMLVAGARDILVPASGAQAAREALAPEADQPAPAQPAEP